MIISSLCSVIERVHKAIYTRRVHKNQFYTRNLNATLCGIILWNSLKRFSSYSSNFAQKSFSIKTCQKYFSLSVSHSISNIKKINHQRHSKKDKMIFCFHLHDFLIAIYQKKQTKSSPFKLSFWLFRWWAKRKHWKISFFLPLFCEWVMLKKEFFLRILWLISRLFIHRFLYVMRGAKIKEESKKWDNIQKSEKFWNFKFIIFECQNDGSSVKNELDSAKVEIDYQKIF